MATTVKARLRCPCGDADDDHWVTITREGPRVDYGLPAGWDVAASTHPTDLIPDDEAEHREALSPDDPANWTVSCERNAEEGLAITGIWLDDVLHGWFRLWRKD